MNKASGFTLLELMITLTLLGVVLGIGIPNLQEMMLDNRRVANTNELISALNAARSEAIKRNTPVVLCPTTDGANCAGTKTWETGWLIFADDDGDDTLDGSEEIVRINESTRAITARSTFTWLSYRPTGRMRTSAGSDNAQFIICDSRSTAKASAVLIMTSGRPQASKTDLDNNAPSSCTP